MLKNQEYQVKWEPEFNYLVDTLPIAIKCFRIMGRKAIFCERM